MLIYIMYVVFVSRSIPGVFPESPRWLLLSERSANMNSLGDRRNSLRDEDSLTGVSADMAVSSHFVGVFSSCFCITALFMAYFVAVH